MAAKNVRHERERLSWTAARKDLDLREAAEIEVLLDILA